MNKAAQQLGRLGGRKTSEAKAAAAKANGSKGGRPRKTPKAKRRTQGTNDLALAQRGLRGSVDEGKKHTSHE